MAETDGIFGRAAAAGDDEGEEDDADNDNDFEGGEPEFKFAKEADATKVVDAEDGDEEDGNKDAWVELFTGDPVLNDQGGGGKLVGCNNKIFEEVAIFIAPY